jgi:hypothetical protein
MGAPDGPPLLRISCFEVLIGECEVGFAQVGRLTSETPLGGPPGEGRQLYATVVLRRALSTSRELFEWRRAVAAGSDDRRDVTIRQLAAPGGAVVNAWRLVGAWPCRWSGPELDAQRDDVAVEELELAFEDLVWLETGPTTRGG